MNLKIYINQYLAVQHSTNYSSVTVSVYNKFLFYHSFWMSKSTHSSMSQVFYFFMVVFNSFCKSINKKHIETNIKRLHSSKKSKYKHVVHCKGCPPPNLLRPESYSSAANVRKTLHLLKS